MSQKIKKKTTKEKPEQKIEQSTNSTKSELVKQVYMDNGATTKIDDKVLEKMIPFLTEQYGNPSSMYEKGREAKKAIEEAREKIARKINANPDEIIFCSGGTESINTAILGIAETHKEKGNHIITSKFEHPAVLRACARLETEGYKVDYVDITPGGFVNISQIKQKITPKTILITIMHANNEIGTIQPIEEIGEICHKNKIIFHSDCVQSFTKVPIDVKKTKINLISISGHKIHGPKGIGALWIRKGTPFKPLIVGGGQENKKRAGTENVAGIVGLGQAAETIALDDISRITSLRDQLIEGMLKIPDTRLNGDRSRRLCNNASITFDFVEGESLLMHLDLAGIQVSTGSACSSLELKASHVLLAIGLPHELCHGTIRFTLSKYTTKEDVEYAVEKTKEIVTTLRKISPFKKNFEAYTKIKG